MTIIIRCFECETRYRVPDERAGKSVKCKKCGTILQIPLFDAEQPKSKDGSAIYRHEFRDRDFEPATGDEENIEAVTQHIESYVGPVEMVFHELISDLVHIDIHWVKPTAGRPWHTLVTSGMSDHPMTVPDVCSEFQYAELSVKLPANWKVSQKAFKSEKNYWPVRLMKTLARLPHEFETWLGIGHTVPNGDPAEPYADNTTFSCALLLPPDPDTTAEGFHCLKRNDGQKIWFYSVVPLYERETNFKLAKGLEKLLQRFSSNGIGDVIDVNRPDICRKKFFGFF